MPPNALYGAVAVGGVGLALRLRERWHAITLTETDPKVLFYALSGDRYKPKDVKSAALWFVEKHHLPPVGERIDEHELMRLFPLGRRGTVALASGPIYASRIALT